MRELLDFPKQTVQYRRVGYPTSCVEDEVSIHMAVRLCVVGKSTAPSDHTVTSQGDPSAYDYPEEQASGPRGVESDDPPSRDRARARQPTSWADQGTAAHVKPWGSDFPIHRTPYPDGQRLRPVKEGNAQGCTLVKAITGLLRVALELT